MLYWILHWLVSGVALWITGLIVPGIRIKDFKSALITILMIGLANVLVRPILLFLSFPITLITFGLFVFVIDGLILRLCSAVLKNFEVNGWMAAIFGAFILAGVETVLHYLLI